MTLAEENYIKAIYHLGFNGTETVNTNAIAEAMNTKASSVTDMIKKLSEKNFVDYKKYQGVTLTDDGRFIAVNMIRKHRLWEVFLVEKLNFNWDEVHEVAEHLEHIKSKKLINQLDKFLGYPTHDPHGEPIPDASGQIKKMDKILLSEALENSSCICVGVQDSSVEFLQYLDKNNIALGATLKVLQIEPFDNSVTIKINEKELVVSNVIAKNLYVKVQ
nr:metal-dependent transcriptional regulator [Tamlana sargassicola]